jgi:hypothetical protein
MPVVLKSPNKIAQPGWLSDDSASQGLKDFQGQLGSLFDTSGLQKAASDYNQNFASRAEMGFDAQARAANNRAQLSGGRVGSSFAKGGLMLGLQGNLMQNQLDYSKLAANMMSQRAGLQGQAAGQLAQYGLGRQGLMSDWTRGQQGMGLQAQMSNQQAALDRARMAQQAAQFTSSQNLQSSQFDRNYDLQQQQSNASLQDSAARRAAMALQALGPGGFNYSTHQGGIPMSFNDAQNQQRAAQYQQQRQGLIGQMTGGYG